MIPRRCLVPILGIVVLGLVGCSDRGGEAAPDLTAIHKQIADLERRLNEQAQQHAEETRLMVRALDASSERLDSVIGALLSGAKGPTKKVSPKPNKEPDTKVGRTDGQNPAKGPRAGTPADAQKPVRDPGKTADPVPGRNVGDENRGDASGDEADAGFDTFEFLLIFLTVALLLLVFVVVFLPGRLRGAVPQVEYSALEDDSIEQEAIAGLQDDLFANASSIGKTDPVAPGPSAFEPPPDTTASAAAPVPSFDPASTSAAGSDADHPVLHELAIRAPNPEDLTNLAEVLDRFLSTDPYILNRPPPQVALDEDELRLRFYALPTLSESEHALLDESIRRLTPRIDDPSATRGGHRGVG